MLSSDYHFITSEFVHCCPQERIRVLLIYLEHLERPIALVKVGVQGTQDHGVNDRTLDFLNGFGVFKA